MTWLAGLSEQLQEAWHQVVFQWELATAGAQDMQWIDTLDFFWDSLPDGDKLSAKQKRQIAHSLKALVRQQSTDLYHKQQSHKEAISRRQELLAQQALEHLASKRLEQMRTMSYLAKEQSSILPAASQLLMASSSAAAQQEQGGQDYGSRLSRASSSRSSSRSSSVSRRQQQQQPLARSAAAGRMQSILEQEQETTRLLDAAAAAAAAVESGELEFGEMEAMQPEVQELGAAMQGQQSLQELQQLLSGALSLYADQLPDFQLTDLQQQQQQQQCGGSSALQRAAADAAVVIDIPVSSDSFTFGSHIPHIRPAAPAAAAAAAWPAKADAAASGGGGRGRSREQSSSSSIAPQQGLLSQAPQGALTEPLLPQDELQRQQQQQEADGYVSDSYEPPVQQQHQQQQQQQCMGVSGAASCGSHALDRQSDVGGGQQLLLERYLSSDHQDSHELSAAAAAAAEGPRDILVGVSLAGCGCVDTHAMSLQSHDSVSSSCSSDASSEQQQQQQHQAAHTDHQQQHVRVKQQQQQRSHHLHCSSKLQQACEVAPTAHKGDGLQPGSSSRWSCDTTCADVDTPRCRGGTVHV